MTPKRFRKICAVKIGTGPLKILVGNGTRMSWSQAASWLKAQSAGRLYVLLAIFLLAVDISTRCTLEIPSLAIVVCWDFARRTEDGSTGRTLDQIFPVFFALVTDFTMDTVKPVLQHFVDNGTFEFAIRKEFLPFIASHFDKELVGFLGRWRRLCFLRELPRRSYQLINGNPFVFVKCSGIYFRMFGTEQCPWVRFDLSVTVFAMNDLTETSGTSTGHVHQVWTVFDSTFVIGSASSQTQNALCIFPQKVVF
jgi:hypothetical protein